MEQAVVQLFEIPAGKKIENKIFTMLTVLSFIISYSKMLTHEKKKRERI
jgi:hypothetical protein